MLDLFIFACVMSLILYGLYAEWFQDNYFLKLQNYDEIMKYIMKNQCHINDEKFFQNDYINYQYGNIKINVLYNEVQFANNKILLSYLQSKKICNCIENLWNTYRMPTVQQLNKRNIL